MNQEALKRIIKRSFNKGVKELYHEITKDGCNGGVGPDRPGYVIEHTWLEKTVKGMNILDEAIEKLISDKSWK